MFWIIEIIFDNDGMIAFISNYKKKKAIKNKYFRHEIHNITDFMKRNLILDNINVFHLKNKIFKEILLFFIFALF